MIYSTKFIWNCPKCSALNSYDPFELTDVSAWATCEDSESTVICHYCHSKSHIIIDSECNIKEISCVGAGNKYYDIHILLKDYIYHEDETRFITQNNIEVTSTLPRDIDTGKKEYIFSIGNFNEYYRNIFFLEKTIEWPSVRYISVRTKNIFEYMSLIKGVSQYFIKMKYHFKVLCEMTVPPSLFNTRDVIVKMQKSKKNNTILLTEFSIEVNESTPNDSILYSTILSSKEKFKHLMDRFVNEE